jgi:hypothetical protein
VLEGLSRGVERSLATTLLRPGLRLIKVTRQGGVCTRDQPRIALSGPCWPRRAKTSAVPSRGLLVSPTARCHTTQYRLQEGRRSTGRTLGRPPRAARSSRDYQGDSPGPHLKASSDVAPRAVRWMILSQEGPQILQGDAELTA